jgi:hypothetical protein
MKSKPLLGAVVGLLLSPIPLVIAMNSTGAGHGDYLWAMILFPIVTFLMFLSPILAVLALLQYPFYGWLAGCALAAKRPGIFWGPFIFMHVIPLILVFTT